MVCSVSPTRCWTQLMYAQKPIKAYDVGVERARKNERKKRKKHGVSQVDVTLHRITISLNILLQQISRIKAYGRRGWISLSRLLGRIVARGPP